jgi:hypothetical protein
MQNEPSAVLVADVNRVLDAMIESALTEIGPAPHTPFQSDAQAIKDGLNSGWLAGGVKP